MTATSTNLKSSDSQSQAAKFSPRARLASRLVNGILAIKPLANFAKNRARNMMIERAETIGVPWRDNVRQLSNRNWDADFKAVANPQLDYPDYYTTSFHAYERGNLNWEAAWEVESAALAVHAKIWSEGDVRGDLMLRQSYHDLVRQQLEIEPKAILDFGCSVGLSSFALQEVFPQAKVTGVDLSPYFLAVAKYRSQQTGQNISWLHAAAESTGLPDASFDLVSACLMFHELPQSAAKAIISEARRLLRSGGYLTIMDMNPSSPIYQAMPPYILTLLKSTEPYLDQYFALDLERAIAEESFTTLTITTNSPRHRTIVARKL
ncbi:class I SAM-dependent methyltransferase [Myxosarcina sp. GI1]|uniref:class I SAM-dependent methyltransferase n=1 Tax=Myxosarcina sp. GI1 TaxID=1541065 RepID=UPI0006899BE3|nr:class I SAM-dependent methyltransferase [Myxosarcina sp. GI1]